MTTSSTTTRPAAAVTQRTLSLGAVIGSVEADGTHAWRGIRYALSPVGPLRWRAPQPVPPWAGTLQALQHGPMAPQFGGLLAPVPPALHGQVVGEEDCLSLNLFAPPFAPDAVPQGAERRPVMVWIHGGGNAVGTSATYDVARKLALHEGVIVVTVNYRLGVLGWFAHPALQQQPGVTDEERSGNFGLLDLIAALRWVHDHIAAFGGDPACVTVFGESAGGQNVLLLMASPLAAGLFHRAIAQSPVCQSFSPAAAAEGLPSLLDSERSGSLAVTQRLREAVPRGAADDAELLRSLSPAQLLGAHRPGSVGIYLTPRPVHDGVVLPAQPLLEVFASGQFNRVPVILGSNRDEYRTFLADKPEHSRLLFGQVPLLRDREAYLAESSFMSAAWRAAHVDAPADAMLAAGHTEVWTYRFDWDEAPAIPFIRPDLLLGACHAVEMAFAFHDTEGEMDPFKVNTPFNRAGRVALAQAMGQAWAAFARSGEPQLKGEQRWPRRPPVVGPDSLLLDTPKDGGLRLAAVRNTLAGLQASLLKAAPDPIQPVPDRLRAQVFARTFLWSPLFSDPAHAGELSAAYAAVQQRFGGPASPEAFRPAVEI